MTIAKNSANRQIARAAGTVMAAFIISNLFGLARQIIVLRTFGATSELDAFNAANRVSETLFNLVAGGALASAFIPTFTGLLTTAKREQAWRLASSIFNLILIFLGVSGTLAIIFAPQIVEGFLVAPSFARNEALKQLTVNLLRIMLPSAAIFGISGLVMAILNAHQVFFIPAITPAMYQVGLIFGVVVLAPRMGIYGLAWGVLIGSGLHLVLQIPTLLKQHGRYTPRLGLDDANVRSVGRLLGPRLLGVAVVQINFWVNIYLATGQAEGSATALTAAFSLMLMPQAAIAQSIAVAAMPTFSAQVALGELAEMRKSLAASLRGVLLLAIPASLGLMLLRTPVIELLYRGGEFGERSTELVAWALLWYAAGLVGHSVVEIVARAFYSLHDTRTPVIVGAAAMSLNILFSLLFSAGFTRLGWMPHGGLALANSVATALEMLALLYLMRRRLGGLGGRRVPGGVLQALGAAIVMSLAILGWMALMAGRPAWLVGAGGVALGGLVYAVCVLVMGVNEAGLLLGALRRRLGF